MDIFRSSAEIWKGVTNLPILIFAVLFGFLLRFRKASRDWQVMFFLLSFDALLGSLVHIFAFPAWARRTLWCILYAGMYETIRLTFFLTVRYETYGRHPKKNVSLFFYALEAACFIASCVLAVFDRDEDIFVLGGLAVCAFLPLLLLAFRRAERAKDLQKAVAVLTVALLGELFKEMLPPAVGVVVCHVGITLALYFIYSLAGKDAGAQV